jgi:hypothetical protein
MGNMMSTINIRICICLEIPWLEEVLNDMTILKGDKHTHARAQAEISLHSSPSSARYRVMTLAPRENPRPSSGARG